VIAILRYMTIKSMRDRSFFGFILLPWMLPPLALIGGSISHKHIQFPLTLDPNLSAAGNATLLTGLTGGMIFVLASVVSFWMLRPEVAARSLGSFIFAVRPVTIIASLTVFATLLGIAGWIGGVAMVTVLTGSVAQHLALETLRTIALTVAMSTAGALMVMISSQPAMVIGAYAFAIAFMPMEKHPTTQLFAAAAVTLVCAVIATILLERRCAT